MSPRARRDPDPSRFDLIETLTRTLRAPTVKQHLAASASVRLADRRPDRRPEPGRRRCAGQAYRQKGQDAGARRGRSQEAHGQHRRVNVVGLRDRALIALLIYSFARISAALHMNVEDYYPQGKRWWVRLHEKGGKQHEMPATTARRLYRRLYQRQPASRAKKRRRCFGRSAAAAASN